MGSGVDEVAEADDCGGETDCGAVEGGDEDFGVRVECVGDEEVVGYEGFEGFAPDVGGCEEGFGHGYVRAAVGGNGSAKGGQIV